MSQASPTFEEKMEDEISHYRVSTLKWRDKFFSPEYAAPNGDKWRIVCYPFGNRPKSGDKNDGYLP